MDTKEYTLEKQWYNLEKAKKHSGKYFDLSKKIYTTMFGYKLVVTGNIEPNTLQWCYLHVYVLTTSGWRYVGIGLQLLQRDRLELRVYTEILSHGA